ncbi:MAG: hypothetical protein FWF73_00600 [Spirochaetes bacterium]|nr:hypothetical protein [Spirochaetota bacterium]
MKRKIDIHFNTFFYINLYKKFNLLKNQQKGLITVIIFSLFFTSLPIYSQNTQALDKQAQEYFDNKEFSKAIALWLSILDTDPNNIEIQKKVESLYELKQKKDLDLEKAKMYYKIAKAEILKNFEKELSFNESEKNFKTAKKNAAIAFESFIIAYRIDPKDVAMLVLRDDMEKLEQMLESEGKKLTSTREKRDKVAALTLLAKTAMKEKRFYDALDSWKKALALISENIEAIEGKRQCEIAIENIVRYETVNKFIASGISFFGINEFDSARQDFMHVLQLDPANNTARNYIEKIDDAINSKKRYEQKLIEAEVFYQSGINNLKDNNFNEARDDFENTLALIPKYKDTEKRLASIPQLKSAYDQREMERKFKRINEELQSGLIALAESRYQEAISAFENVLKLDPGNTLVPAYIQRAKDAQRLVDEEVVDENSPYYNLINPLIVSGKRLFESGKYEESKKRWNQILELFPSNRVSNEYIFKCELKLNPDNSDAVIKRIISEGEKLLKNKEYRSAYRKFDIVRSTYPNYPEIQNLIKKAEMDNLYGATGAQPLTQSDITDIETRYNLGMAYYQKGGEENIKRALVELRWVAAKDPNNIKAVVAVNRIESQLRSGTGSETGGGRKLTAEQEALVRKHYFNGINYYSNNDFNKAIAEWRKVLAIDPNHTNAKNNIRKCLALLGQ